MFHCYLRGLLSHLAILCMRALVLSATLAPYALPRQEKGTGNGHRKFGENYAVSNHEPETPGVKYVAALRGAQQEREQRWLQECDLGKQCEGPVSWRRDSL